MNGSPHHLKLIRFQQRRVNLNDAFSFLEETLSSNASERVKNAAVVKAFEMAFELCWKALKDLLEYKGISVKAPRDILKEAFQIGYLEDGQTWIDLLDQRNVLVHIYNESQAETAMQTIRDHAFPSMKKLVEKLNHEK